MKVLYTKKFLKDLSKVPSSHRKNIEEIVFEIIPSQAVKKIANLKKLSGFNNFYRIRYNNYRIGIEESDQGLVFKRVLHRKDIYRYFP